MPPLGA